MKKSWQVAAAIAAAVVLLGGGVLLGWSMRGAQRGTGSTLEGAAATRSDGSAVGAKTSPSGKPSGSASATVGQSGRTSALVPQKKSVPLEAVTTPPSRTMAFLDAKQFTAEAVYDITFAPYGTGTRPDTLVISILTSKPRGKVAKPFDFVGKNALVDMSTLSAETAISTGGMYDGALRLSPEGDVLALTLVTASRSE